jgi:hypothetical protein
MKISPRKAKRKWREMKTKKEREKKKRVGKSIKRREIRSRNEHATKSEGR